MADSDEIKTYLGNLDSNTDSSMLLREMICMRAEEHICFLQSKKCTRSSETTSSKPTCLHQKRNNSAASSPSHNNQNIEWHVALPEFQTADRITR